MRVALYLHFPYCRSRCSYCDFNAYTDVGAEGRSDYIGALCEDIRQTGRQGRYRIETVFLGGGTPSLHSAQELAQVLECCREAFDFRPSELTLEANPGTLSLLQLEGLRRAGLNRLSLGVQSFRSSLLHRLNRIHSPEEVVQAVHWARQAGFENLSLDLIYGLPGQGLGDWQDSVEQALELAPQHLSIYQLTVEPGTHLQAQLRQGVVRLPGEGRTLAMDRWMRRRLRQAGFQRYEVSNWCQPGRHSRHNLAYWKDLPYLGLGCGASGYLRGWRTRRLLHPHAYQQALERGIWPVVAAERRDAEGALRDFLMMGLRTRWGIPWVRLQRRFPDLSWDRLRVFFERLPQAWWRLDGQRLRLTARGSDFVSSVCQEMMDCLLLGEAEEAKFLSS